MKTRLHQNEIAIDTDLVRKLVDSELPEYSALPLIRLDASGSTNVLFRLGDDLLVCLPRQPGGSVAIDKERRWLPEIGRHIPVAVPEIIAIGEPAFGFGERWSIVRWLDGELPIACSPDDPPAPERLRLADDLADVILAIRSVDVPDAATTDPALRWYRGRPLAEFDERTRYNIQKCRSIEGLDLDLDAALAVWTRALEAPGAFEVGPDRWYHSGDLVAENLLLTNGRLTGVLDFGGLSVGTRQLTCTASGKCSTGLAGKRSATGSVWRRTNGYAAAHGRWRSRLAASPITGRRCRIAGGTDWRWLDQCSPTQSMTAPEVLSGNVLFCWRSRWSASPCRNLACPQVPKIPMKRWRQLPTSSAAQQTHSTRTMARCSLASTLPMQRL